MSSEAFLCPRSLRFSVSQVCVSARTLQIASKIRVRDRGEGRGAFCNRAATQLCCAIFGDHDIELMSWRGDHCAGRERPYAAHKRAVDGGSRGKTDQRSIVKTKT